MNDFDQNDTRNAGIVGACLLLALVLLLGLALAKAEDLPAAPKVADKKFFAVAAVSAGAIAFDAYTTAGDISRRKGCEEQGEPWLVGRFPGNARLAAVGAGEFALTTGVAYLVKRTHNRVLRQLWEVPGGARAGIHIAAGIHNMSVCQ